MCLFHMKSDISGYNIYSSWAEAAGPQGQVSVHKFLKLPRGVLKNFSFYFLPLVCYRLETEQKIIKVLSQVPVQTFFHSTCVAANWQKTQNPLLVQSVVGSAQSSGSSSESRRSLSDSWSVLLVLVASSSSSELPSQDVWNSLISSLNLWDTCRTEEIQGDPRAAMELEFHIAKLRVF